MGRVIPAFAQYLDGNGDPLAYGWLQFLVSGSNNTPKDTYNDPLYQIANANPLQLDAEGRCPSVFGVGDYRVISFINDPDEEDTPGEQLQVFDPVTAQGSTISGGGSGAVFDDWSATETYELGSIVVRDLGYYRSLINSNLNLDPLIETYAWEQIDFLAYWNNDVTYETGDLVYYLENLYLSLADANIGNIPLTSPSYWRAVATGCKGYLNQTGNYTITTLDREYLIILTAAATADATFDLPAMDASLSKFCLWIYNASDYTLTIDASGTAGIWLNTSGIIELTKGAMIQLGYNSYLDCWLPMGNVGPLLGNQYIGTTTFPVLDIFTDNITTAAATITDLRPTTLYFGALDDVEISFTDGSATFNIETFAGVTTNYTVDSVIHWVLEPTGEFRPGASNPSPYIGTAANSIDYVYTNNISLPDAGYAYFGDDDDMILYSTGSASVLTSTLPVAIATTTLSAITFSTNSVATLQVNTDNSVSVFGPLYIPNTDAVFYMGSPTEFRVQRTDATSPTYINAYNYAVVFQSGGSTVLSYDSTLDIEVYHNLHIRDNNDIFFGTDEDANISFDTTTSTLQINTDGAYGIDLMTNNTKRWGITSIGYIEPNSPGAYRIGNSTNWVGRVYSAYYIGSGSSLIFGLNDSSLFQITDIYEEYLPAPTDAWRMVVEIYGNGRTYYFYGNP